MMPAIGSQTAINEYKEPHVIAGEALSAVAVGR